MSGQQWRGRAACIGHDPELWFPSPGDSRRAEEARAICAGCPVRAECLADVLAAPMPGGRSYGIWGGLSEKQRRGLRVAAGARSGRSRGRKTIVPEPSRRRATRTEKVA